MKKLTSYIILGLIVLICLLFIIEVLSFFGIFVVMFPFLGYWVKDGIITNEISYSLFVLAFILFFAFLAFKKCKTLLFNISIIILLIAATEKYLVLTKKKPKAEKIIDSPGWAVKSDTLGYRPERNFKDHSKAYSGNTLLYDVHYTTDEHGLRKTPPISADSLTKSAVFFGCSFTFGIGINDNDVMPNIVQKLVQNKYKVYNFGYGGYGTHQMLTLIEKNMVDSIVKYEPKIFIYALIPDHLNRILDLVPYGHHCPKYILDTNTHEVKYAGLFDDFNNLALSKIKNSEIYGLFKKKKAEISDVILFVKMVQKSQTLLKNKYPNSEFHVLFWDNKFDKIGSLMLKELKNTNISTHIISEIVPDYYRSTRQYCVKFPYEFHPNGKINRKIAAYLVNNVLIKKDTLQ
jgi:hypothetical protein